MNEFCVHDQLLWLYISDGPFAICQLHLETDGHVFCAWFER